MQCPLCSHDQNHKHGQTSKGNPDAIVLIAEKLSTKLLTLFIIVKKRLKKKLRWFYSLIRQGSSFLEISQTTKLAHNTVMSLIRATSIKV